MKPNPVQPPGEVSIRVLAALALLSILPILLYAAPPGWWTSRNVTTGGTANDYAVANQGQLKNIATAAFNELSANLPGGVGDMTAPSGTFPGGTGYQLTALINSWSTTTSGTVVEITGSNTNDYAAVNLGQLKHASRLFYKRLIEAGFASYYPWESTGNPPNDYGVANIGQVKNLFSFDVTTASDSDGVPDMWELNNFGTIGISGTSLAPSGNGLTVYQSYEDGVSPIDYYNGVSPTLTITGGNNQTGAPGAVLTSPLVVQVTGTSGSPLVNAPVTFAVAQGVGLLAPDISGTSATSDSLQVLTDSSGNAQVYFQQPFDASFTSDVAVYAEGSQVDFSETTAADTDTPAAPSNVTATGQPDGSALVTWQDNSDNETGFTIQRSDDGGSTWVTVGTVGPDTTSFIDPANNGISGTSPIPGITQYLPGSTGPAGDPPAITSGTLVMPFITIDYVHFDVSGTNTQNIPFSLTNANSGAVTTTSTNANVLNMAMDDNNQASYCFVSGSFSGTSAYSYENPFSGINQITVNTWNKSNSGTTASGTITCDAPGQTITTQGFSGLSTRDESLSADSSLYQDAVGSDDLGWIESPYVLSPPPSSVLLTSQGTAYGTAMEDCYFLWYSGGDSNPSPAPRDNPPITISNAFSWSGTAPPKHIMEFTDNSFTTGTQNLIINNSATYLQPEFSPVWHGNMVLACSSSGTYYCGVGDFGIPDLYLSGASPVYTYNDFFLASYICSSSGTTIFYDPSQGNNTLLESLLPGSVNAIDTPFTPAAINDNGFAIGGKYYWNGWSLTQLGDNAVVTALNDQNLAVGYDLPYGTKTPMLWMLDYHAAGAVLPIPILNSLVPQPYQNEIEDIVPFAISNADAHNRVSILCSASVFENATGPGSATAWKPETLLLQVDATSPSGTSDSGTAPPPTISIVKIPKGVTFQNPNNLAVNSSGVVSGVGTITDTPQIGPPYTTPEEALALLPVQLINIADPTVRNNANGKDMPIQFKQFAEDNDVNCVAWIAGNDPTNNNAPRMPQLRARIGGSAGLSGMTVYWKLKVMYGGTQNNTYQGYKYRDFDTGATLTTPQKNLLTNIYESGTIAQSGSSDNIVVPAQTSGSTDTDNSWHKITTSGTVNGIWNIYQDPDWQSAVARGFFGGGAVLSLRVESGTTNIIPQHDFKFRIAGENPTPSSCESYISTTYGGTAANWTGLTYVQGKNPPVVTGFWFAFAIAKAETDGNGGRTYYSQFLDDGGTHNSRATSHPIQGRQGYPNWHNDPSANPPGTGGYGLFQLTFQGPKGNHPAEKNFIMPRDWIWNWQSNVQQFRPIIQQKLQDTQDFLNRTKKAHRASFTDPSSLTTVADTTTFNFWESAVITRYNSAAGWTFTPGSGDAPGTWTYTPNPENYLYEVAHEGVENHP